MARLAVYVLLAGGLIATVVQFQALTIRNTHRAQKYARLHPGATAGELERFTEAKGAITRWRKAIRQFWAGRNIYGRHPAVEGGAPQKTAGGSPPVWLHPNMPFTVILLSPMAYMSVPTMAIVWNLLKLAVIVLSLLLAVRVANHDGKRMADWIVALGAAWTLLFVIGDIQHANTNVFVLGAIALHLWLYRSGRDVWAGSALALAICLKMTPALFILYWAYQRNWKLLAGAACGLIVAQVIPWIVLDSVFGPGHFFLLAGSWMQNLILPGLVKGSWYPIHINQSIPGVLSRYFLGGNNGNIFWNPDDTPVSAQRDFGYIHVAVLGEHVVKIIARLCQLAVVALVAWAIGWRKLPRDDGRRALHYALVLLAMLLLNQRTWDHHAAILLIAGVAIWYAIAFGRMSRRARAAALILVIAAGPLVWLGGKETFKLAGRITGQYKVKVGPDETFTTWGSRIVFRPDNTNDKPVKLTGIWHDMAEAYGTTFLFFALMFAATVVLSVAMRSRGEPYADERQKLFTDTG